MDNEALAELAWRQHGVFARWQAAALGFTRTTIQRRIEQKQWTTVLGRIVLAAATTRLSSEGRAWASYLACGPGAVLSGPSAMRRHGLDAPSTAKVWVTVPPERHVRIEGVQTIRESVPPEDIVELDGMRVTTIGRSIVDTLRVLPGFVGQTVVDKALLRGWITPDELGRRVEQFYGRRGNRQLRLLKDRAHMGAHSEAEHRLHVILNAAQITGWVANFKLFNEAGLLEAVLDVAFEAERIALEIDGLAFHVGPSEFQHDRTRQNILVNGGWRVLRFTWDDITKRPGYVVRTVRAALAAARETHR